MKGNPFRIETRPDEGKRSGLSCDRGNRSRSPHNDEVVVLRVLHEPILRSKGLALLLSALGPVSGSGWGLKSRHAGLYQNAGVVAGRASQHAPEFLAELSSLLSQGAQLSLQSCLIFVRSSQSSPASVQT